MTDTRWWEQAACRHLDPDVFDCDRSRYNVPTPERRTDYAQRACGDCPVMAQCAADALNGPARGTVRAGMWLPDRWENVGKHEKRLNTVALLLLAKGVPRSLLTMDYETGHVHVTSGGTYSVHDAPPARVGRPRVRARG